MPIQNTFGNRNPLPKCSLFRKYFSKYVYGNCGIREEKKDKPKEKKTRFFKNHIAETRGF